MLRITVRYLISADKLAVAQHSTQVLRAEVETRYQRLQQTD